MSILQNSNAISAPAGGDFYDHQISKSVRLGDSGYLKRTPSGAGNRATWTFSTWLKLTQIGTSSNADQPGGILNAGSSGNQDGFYRLNYYIGQLFSSSAEANFFFSNGVYRDISGWYHVVWKQGSGTATVYVNGEAASGATASVSGNTAVNNSVQHVIGGASNTLGETPLKAYLAETIMIDGTALGPDSFGTTKNGVWIPKDASGLTFGTNGFHLDYADSSALGNDVSGNNNDWTSVNLSTHDSMLDSPTFNSDSNGGNFATWNPLRVNQQTQTFAEGNTRFSSTQTYSNPAVTGTLGATSGKWYWEIRIVAQGDTSNSVGVCRTSAGLEADTTALWGATGDVAWMYLAGGNKRTNATSSSYGNSWTTGDILQVAMDIDNGAVYFGKNNTWQNSGNPTSGASKTGAAFTNLADKGHLQPYSLVYNNGDQVVNFGPNGTFNGAITAGGNADDTGYGNFKYDPPTGFLAMCSGNLPVADAVDPAQTDDNFPQKLFSILQYTGNGGQRTISTDFQFDYLWSRSTVQGQNWYNLDTSRGIFGSNNYYLKIDVGDAEADLPQDNYISQTASGSDAGGYVLSSGTWFNSGTHKQKNWYWRANAGTTASNTTGGTNSVTQVDPSGGFSIVTYTGFSGSSGSSTVGHGLSVAPAMVIHKSRTRESGWWTQFPGLLTDAGYFLELAGTNAQTNLNSYGTMNVPTTSVFTINGVDGVGGESANYVAYCFANIEGYIKVGKYTANGSSTDNAFAYTGFSPRMIIIKGVRSGDGWCVFDTLSHPYNMATTCLQLNSNSATLSNYNIDILSNGFKVRDGDGDLGSSSVEYVFIAFAENPFAFATAR